MKCCFFRMMVNFVSLTLHLKMMEVMMIRRKAVAVHQLGSHYLYMYTPCAGLCKQLFTAIPRREIIIPQGIVQSEVLSCFQTY